MKKILFYLLAVLLITACNSKSNNASNDSETATVTEDSGGAKHKVTIRAIKMAMMMAMVGKLIWLAITMQIVIRHRMLITLI